MNPPSDIQSWLEDLGLGELAPVFRENHITPDVLPDLTADDLREMGITSLGQRKKLLAAFAEKEAPYTTLASEPVPEPPELTPAPDPVPAPISKTAHDSKPGPRLISMKASGPVVRKVAVLVPEYVMPSLEPLPVSTGRKSRRKAFSGALC